MDIYNQFILDGLVAERDAGTLSVRRHASGEAVWCP